MTVWIAFALVLAFVVLLAMDLGAFGGRGLAHAPGDAAVWTCVWIVLGLSFNFVVYSLYEFKWQGDELAITQALTGRQAAEQFFAGFIGQKMLSVATVFIIALLFAHFETPLKGQERILFWGVFGALTLRAVFATAGTGLMATYDWIVYFFGGVAMYSSAALVAARHTNRKVKRNPLVRLAWRYYPMAPSAGHDVFFVRQKKGRRMMTPALVTLLMTQSAALVFAISSVPVFAIFTRKPFIIVVATACACLGMRSLYFVVAAAMERFRFMKIALGLSLAVVSLCFLFDPYVHVPFWLTLTVLCLALGSGILAACFHHDAVPLLSPLAQDLEELGAVSVKQARRVVILTMGSSLCLLGLVFLLTPMPSLLTIIAGLAALSTEFVWARRWLKKLREQTDRLRNSIFKSDDPS
jgi:tellurite resistance protein TerC